LGGSFDPVHQQHLQVALAALLECHLDEIWFVPVFQPVHKGHVLLDYQHRRHLLQAALRDCPHSKICDVEMELGGPSYTFRTLEVLKERHSEHQFFLIIGGDSLAELPSWRNIEALVRQTEFIVVERPGFERQSPVADAIIHWAPCVPSSIASVDIRARLAQHDFAGIGLPFEVMFHILLHNYYGSLGETYRQWLKLVTEKQAKAPEGLREHMCSVARMAVRYSLELDCDPRPALIAGMVHDVFRDAPDAEIVALVGNTNFILNDLQREIPMLAHGPAAAAWLLKVAPEIDSTIISAVKNHTFPVADSPLLTRIMAVADTLDPVRKMPERDAVREAEMTFSERYQKVLELKLLHD
jgi:nicotinate-nucleotide adenylyltransferase